jgi:SH3-like domain-containing protein
VTAEVANRRKMKDVKGKQGWMRFERTKARKGEMAKQSREIVRWCIGIK